MNPQTRANLLTAMQGEAFAHAKYLLYAERARQHGEQAIAALFEEAGKMERLEHFAEEAALYGLAGTDAANLGDAIEGERHEVEVMYREFAAQAQAVGDTAAAERFVEIRGDEARHRDAFQAALNRLQTRAR